MHIYYDSVSPTKLQMTLGSIIGILLCYCFYLPNLGSWSRFLIGFMFQVLWYALRNWYWYKRKLGRQLRLERKIMKKLQPKRYQDIVDAHERIGNKNREEFSRPPNIPLAMGEK